MKNLYNKGSRKITKEGEFNHDETKEFTPEQAESLLKLYPNEIKDLTVKNKEIKLKK